MCLNILGGNNIHVGIQAGIQAVETFDVFVSTAAIFLASKPEPIQQFPSIKSR